MPTEREGARRHREDLRSGWSGWHGFWARLFGKRMPTSGMRAHIGNLTLQHRPHGDSDWFNLEWTTDARRIYVIGDLWVFDYGDTPVRILTPEPQPAPRDLGDHQDLLADNLREYGVPAPRTATHGA